MGIVIPVLWLALKLVSLHYQIQPLDKDDNASVVVISFKISIFALSNTTQSARESTKESCD